MLMKIVSGYPSTFCIVQASQSLRCPILTGPKFKFHRDKIALVSAFHLAALEWDVHDDIRPEIKTMNRYGFLIFLLDDRRPRQRNKFESMA